MTVARIAYRLNIQLSSMFSPYALRVTEVPTGIDLAMWPPSVQEASLRLDVYNVSRLV